MMESMQSNFDASNAHPSYFWLPERRVCSSPLAKRIDGDSSVSVAIPQLATSRATPSAQPNFT